MCGRKTLTRDMLTIIEDLAIDDWQDPEGYFPSYNIAPTQVSPILIYQAKRVVRPMRWGLIPNWARDKAIGARMINARAETLLEKPSFRSLVHRRRCVVIADGYYEWQTTETGRQPYFIHHPAGNLLPMAGLWDTWKDPAGDIIDSYTVITTEPRADLAHIHNRMPVILPEISLDAWLNYPDYPFQRVQSQLKPAPFALEAYPVSTLVNSPRNNSPECLTPLLTKS